MLNAIDSSSTKPYLIRALYEWCTDNGFTPYVAVAVDDSVRVPREFVKDGEIVLNVSFDATSDIRLGNDFIEFKARFGGIAREIVVPIERVMAIYARENGQGMAFPLSAAAESVPAPELPQAEPDDKGARKRPNLTVAHSAASTPAPPVEEDEGPDEPPPLPPGLVGLGRPALKRIK